MAKATIRDEVIGQMIDYFVLADRYIRRIRYPIDEYL